MLVLGVESSCDETGIALYDSAAGLLSHALHSQVAMHQAYGGVVPELASRDHVRRVVPLVQEVLGRAGLEYAREIEQEIYYKDLPQPIGTRRADFVVEGKVLVEIKALTQLEDVHWAQVLNYLRAYRLEVGLLLNFGSKSLTFKRLVL